jgi:hypothetical protein
VYDILLIKSTTKNPGPKCLWEKMVRLERKKMHAMRGSKDLYSRILGGIGKESEGQTQLQYFICEILKNCKF